MKMNTWQIIYLFYFLFLSILISCSSDSQSFKGKAPDMEWHKSYQGSGEEAHGHYIIVCSDGGFLQVGETGFIQNSTAKIFVVKTDSLGELLWKKEIGEAGHNLGNSVIETADSNYLLAGALNQNSALIKLDASDGSIIWEQTYPNSGEDAIEGIDETSDGGIICAGYTNGAGEHTFFSEGKGYLMKTDANGTLKWHKDMSSYVAQCYRVKEVNDGYIVSGLTEEAMDFALIKTGFSGEVKWNNIYGGTADEHCFGMDVSGEGNIYLTGHTRSGTINWDTYTVKVSPDGRQVWENTRGNPRGYDPEFIHDEAWGVRATPDGGCLVVAGTGDEYPYSSCDSSPGCSDQWCIYLIKYSYDGTFDWEQVVTDKKGNHWAGEDVALTCDGGCIVAIDDSGFGFVKFASFGSASADCK